ncbi:MAG TPA: pyruvate:ferredoxin (flavodoxin) oxidoreductase, partial [Lachnospiraceae bacterium]|nr:pyruvate:ferredoxin (flavodoxin) oxidoreductase [Lachnospiraceae bacterium]
MIRNTQTMDGCQAAAHVAYAYSEAAAIFPITPSSPMAELCDEWAGNGRKNIYGFPMVISQMQSEAGAAAAVHGALLAGTLATTFTASQGLLLMLPNLYRMAGELLPGVIHVAARSIATHALSIFGDHSDIYACRQTGMAFFSESSVQEVMDLSPVAHLAALEGRIPFVNFFDGFRTSHELHKIKVWDYKDLASMLNPKAAAEFRERSLHPSHGKVYGSAQNPDIFFQAREASNPYYQALPQIVEHTLEKINALLGTSYGLFDYYGAPDAEHVTVAMGSICETIKEYIDSAPEKKYGLIVVHLYRPFSAVHLAEKLPESVRQITVLDRTKEPGAPGEPLYLDVVTALVQCGFPVCAAQTPSDSARGFRYSSQNTGIRVFSGRYGLSSKDTTPEQIAAIYNNHSKTCFTAGITDDVTHLSLPVPPIHQTVSSDIVSCKFWGLGGDGTVSATKNAIKIIGNHTDMDAQGYFEYDSKKSRGLTISHLRFGKTPIHSAYLIHRADLVACHNPVYLHKYDMVREVKDGGIFLINFHPDKQAESCNDTEPVRQKGAGSTSRDRKDRDDAISLRAQLDAYLPEATKDYIARHDIRLFFIDAIGIGKEIGLNNKISTILQAAFFAVSGLLDPEDARRWMKEAAEKSYGKNGGKILEMNRTAIDRGFSEVMEIEIPKAWADCALQKQQAASGTAALDNSPLPDRPEMIDFVKKIQQPVTDQRGNELPVSAFLPYADGCTPPGSSAHERRAVATEIPVWKPENCIQCTRCSFVCPHAVIRPAVLKEPLAPDAPKGLQSIPMMGMDGCHFAITVSSSDCTGCGTCAAVCPGKQKKGEEKPSKALEMVPAGRLLESGIFAQNQDIFDYCKPLLPCREAAEKFRPDTPKGSQFLRPLMEFSGACAGCGETAYVKLLTQLFGDRMYIANATGCSSIWANSSPSCAYTLDENGHGPAWSNSLFEDAAEFGYGMLMAQEAAAKRDRKHPVDDTGTDTSTDPGVSRNHIPGTPETAETPSPTIQWIIGGDGWAYDIGYG